MALPILALTVTCSSSSSSSRCLLTAPSPPLDLPLIFSFAMRCSCEMLQVGGQRQLLFWANTQLRLLGSGVQLLQLQQLLLLLLPSQQEGQGGDWGPRARAGRGGIATQRSRCAQESFWMSDKQPVRSAMEGHTA